MGTWRRTFEKRTVVIETNTFTALTDAESQAVADAARSIWRLFGSAGRVGIDALPVASRLDMCGRGRTIVRGRIQTGYWGSAVLTWIMHHSELPMPCGRDAPGDDILCSRRVSDPPETGCHRQPRAKNLQHSYRRSFRLRKMTQRRIDLERCSRPASDTRPCLLECL